MTMNKKVPTYVSLRTSGGIEPWMGSVLLSSDGNVTTNNVIGAGSYNQAYNNTTWDRWRNNTQMAVLTSSARTATTSSSDQINYNARGVYLVFDVAAVSGSPSLTLAVQVKDPASNKYIDILASAAVTSVSTTIFKLYPGITAAANIAASEALMRTWRVQVRHGTADSVTYSVGYSLIL